MASVYVPGFGFRPSDGVRMVAPVVVEQEGRALKVLDLSTTTVSTDVAFEIRDDSAQAACLSGAIEHDVFGRANVTLRDDRGTSYARSEEGENGISLGQHEFGFFGRKAAFERLPGTVRRAFLGVSGALGDWDVAIELAPITETGAVPVDELGAAATARDVTVRLVRAAFGADQTFIEVEATSTRPAAAIAGIGEIQREGDQRMVIRDGAGHRYVEELSRETVRRSRGDPGRAYAKFPARPDDASDLVLMVPSVQLEDREPHLDVALPLTERREMRLGRYAILVGPIESAHDLLAPPGKQPSHGLRLAVGPAGSSDEQALRPLALGIDGKAERWGWGWGWHPEPELKNLSIEVPADVIPRSVRLEGAIVRVRGPWEIRFTRPR